MSSNHYGSEYGDSIVWLPNQPTRQREGAKWGFKWKGWCKLALAHDDAGGLIPTNGTAMNASPFNSTLANASDYKLTNVEVSETQAPDIVEVLFSLAPDGDPESQHQDGDIEKRCEVITIPLGVDDQAAYDAFPSEVDAAKAQGKKTIDLPGLKYTYSEYDNNFQWTEDNLIAASGVGMGKVGYPTGITGIADPQKWMFRGTEISETKGLTRRTENWERACVQWPNDGTQVGTTTTTTTA